MKCGRALLPRKLQLLKDAREPGSDKLLLKWLHDQMVGASEAHFNIGLEPEYLKLRSLIFLRFFRWPICLRVA